MTGSDALPTRRRVLAGAAAALAAGGLVSVTAAACAPSGGGTGDGGGGSLPATVATGDVPVGGGTILGDAAIVVTQPTVGQFKAFSAVCPHQGCLVSSVQAKTITCTCHGSRFSAIDGSVLAGPASRALAARKVTRSGDTLTIS